MGATKSARLSQRQAGTAHWQEDAAVALKGARRTRCRSGRCGPPGTLPWSVTPTRSWMPSPSLGEDEDSVGRQRHVVGAVVVVGVNVGVGVVAGSQSRRRPERMTENIRPVREGHGRFAVVPPNTRPPHHGRWDAGQAFGRWAGYCIGGWADAAYCFGPGLVAAQFAHTGERGSGGGAAGIRTPDLLIANETRYQLRHSPEVREQR